MYPLSLTFEPTTMDSLVYRGNKRLICTYKVPGIKNKGEKGWRNNFGTIIRKRRAYIRVKLLGARLDFQAT